MAEVGFLGLGNMGSAMVSRLVGAGHDVLVWNRSPEAGCHTSPESRRARARSVEIMPLSSPVPRLPRPARSTMVE